MQVVRIYNANGPALAQSLFAAQRSKEEKRYRDEGNRCRKTASYREWFFCGRRAGREGRLLLPS
jgi:hypothetical protein